MSTTGKRKCATCGKLSASTTLKLKKCKTCRNKAKDVKNLEELELLRKKVQELEKELTTTRENILSLSREEDQLLQSEEMPTEATETELDYDFLDLASLTDQDFDFFNSLNLHNSKGGAPRKSNSELHPETKKKYLREDLKLIKILLDL